MGRPERRICMVNEFKPQEEEEEEEEEDREKKVDPP